MESTQSVTIPRSLISSPEDILLPPSDFSTPEQLALLDSHESCHSLGRLYRREAKYKRDKTQLDNALFCSKRVTQLYTVEDALRKKYFFHLGDDHAARYDHEGDGADLEAAIEALEISVRQDSDRPNLGGTGRGEALKSYSRAVKMRYTKLDSEADFELSRSTVEDALLLYNELDDLINCAECCELRGTLCLEKFDKYLEENDDYVDVIDSIMNSIRDMTFNQTLNQEKPAEVVKYTAFFDQAKDDFNVAIDILEDLFAAETDEEIITRYHSDLGRLYFTLSKTKTSVENGNEAYSHMLNAVHNTPDSDPARYERLERLAECYRHNIETEGFDFQGRATKAEIAAQKHAINNPADHGSLEPKAKLHYDLSWSYYERFESEKGAEDARNAIEEMTKAVAETDADDEKHLVDNCRIIGYLAMQIHGKIDMPELLTIAIPYARRGAKICETATGLENSTKALAIQTAARLHFDKFDVDKQVNGEMAKEAVLYATRAVELIRTCCDANDDCQECQDKTSYVRELRFMRKNAGMPPEDEK